MRADGKFMLRGRDRKPTLDGNGYSVVSLTKNQVPYRKYVHVAVLEAFVGPRPPKHDGCHNDGDNTNNHLSNLRWDTRSSNIRDAVKHRTHAKTRLTHCPRGHELNDTNNESQKRVKGYRSCLACSVESHNSRNQSREFDADRADSEYQRIMTVGLNTVNGQKTHCPRGHPLVTGNLIASVVRKGGRSCLACSRARAYSQRNKEPFSPSVAEEYFRKLGLEA